MHEPPGDAVHEVVVIEATKPEKKNNLTEAVG